MRLVVGTNFDDELIGKIRQYPVTHVFGSHTRTLTGHGRASFILRRLTTRGSRLTWTWFTGPGSSSFTP